MKKAEVGHVQAPQRMETACSTFRLPITYVLFSENLQCMYVYHDKI